MTAEKSDSSPGSQSDAGFQSDARVQSDARFQRDACQSLDIPENVFPCSSQPATYPQQYLQNHIHSTELGILAPQLLQPSHQAPYLGAQLITPIPQSLSQYFASPQQQCTRVFVIRDQPTPVYKPYHVNFQCAIILSCFVMWFCGFLFGLTAYVIAEVGQRESTATSAHRMLNYSYGFSYAGIGIGFFVIMWMLSVQRY